MRVESMVAQQAVLAQAAHRAVRSSVDRRSAAGRQPSAPTGAGTATPGAGTNLPTAVADRIASLFADDPGLAEAVYARLPAARQASATDLAAYGAGAHRAEPRILDTIG